MCASETPAQCIHVIGVPQGKFCISQCFTFFVWCSEEFMSTSLLVYCFLQQHVNMKKKKRLMETNKKKVIFLFIN